MNLCEAELNKSMYDIVLHRLASLLEVALRMSTADSDPYKDDLKPELLPYDLQYQMFRILSIQTRDEKGILLKVLFDYVSDQRNLKRDNNEFLSQSIVFKRVKF